jgi:hypothetical protein
MNVSPVYFSSGADHHSSMARTRRQAGNAAAAPVSSYATK